jgi:uncharacterized protein (DUF1786 family)
LKALTLDIGAGTVDILLYEEGIPVENSIKMVLPSPPRYFAKLIKETKKKDLWIKGYTIGGGSLTSAVKGHIKEGGRVYMTPGAAYSLRNNLNEVRDMGVEIVPEYEVSGESIFLDELMLGRYENFLQAFGESIKDVDFVGVSVKDHGAPPRGMSNREFRINEFSEMLRAEPSIHRFLLHEDEVPEYFLRMKSSIEAVQDYLPEAEVYVMDTSPSAVLGCLVDPRVAGKDPVLAVNVGNGHTMAAVISRGRYLGFFEHHTGKLMGEELEGLMIRLCNGELTHREVFQEGGHGAVKLGEMPGFQGIEVVGVTGPRRGLLENSKIEHIQPAPAGDVMMTGTMGILNAALTSYKKIV